MKSKKLLAAALAAVLTLAGCGTTVLSAEETKELLTLRRKPWQQWKAWQRK